MTSYADDDLCRNNVRSNIVSVEFVVGGLFGHNIASHASIAVTNIRDPTALRRFGSVRNENNLTSDYFLLYRLDGQR
jgi:hypothetical protein